MYHTYALQVANMGEFPKHDKTYKNDARELFCSILITSWSRKLLILELLILGNSQQVFKGSKPICFCVGVNIVGIVKFDGKELVIYFCGRQLEFLHGLSVDS